MRKLTLFFACLAGFPLFAASARFSRVVMYQPNDVLWERLGKVDTLAAYIQEVRTVCEGSFKTDDAEGLDVVIVLKPNGKVRAWFVPTLGKMPDRGALNTAIEAIAAPPVRNGPVILALSYDLNGFARPSSKNGKIQPSMPDEWKAEVKKAKSPLVVPDGLIPYVWPD